MKALRKHPLLAFPIILWVTLSLSSCADECCTYMESNQEITECRNNQVNRGDWSAVRGYALSQGGVCD